MKWWKDDVTRDGTKQSKNVIFVESKPRDLGTFGLVHVDSWVSSDEMTDVVKPNQPLSIFASVTRGNSPVLNAKVTAVMEVLMKNGTIEKYSPIELYDNGNGADLVANDGLYSRYFTQFDGVNGRYTLKCQVYPNLNFTREPK